MCPVPCVDACRGVTPHHVGQNSQDCCNGSVSRADYMNQFAVRAGKASSSTMSVFCDLIEPLRTVLEQQPFASSTDICLGSFAVGLCAGIPCRRRIYVGTPPFNAALSVPRALTIRSRFCGSFLALCICAATVHQGWCLPFRRPPITATRG